MLARNFAGSTSPATPASAIATASAAKMRAVRWRLAATAMRYAAARRSSCSGGRRETARFIGATTPPSRSLLLAQVVDELDQLDDRLVGPVVDPPPRPP